jgi:hypothetical protein
MVQQTEQMSNRLAYFEWAVPQIVIAANHQGETVAWVPSASSNDPYVVTIDESTKIPHATDCSCKDRYYRKNYCKHMQAADLFFQNIAAIFAHAEEEQIEQPEGIEVNALLIKNRDLYRSGQLNEQCQHQDNGLDGEIHQYVNMYEIEGPTKHVRCQGCGGICGEGNCKDCKPGFCLWNSWWTEAQRAAK